MNDEIIVNLKGRVLRAFSYIGGKSRYIDELYKYFPTNFSSFYDVCGGSGVVTFSMNFPPFCNKVVLNDYDPTIHNFYATLKGDRGEELERRLIEFNYDSYDALDWAGDSAALDDFEMLDEVEAAVCVYRQIVSSFSGTRNGYVKKLEGYLNSVTKKNIPLIRQRLQNIEVTKRDFIDILKEVKDPQTFVYIDVPYRMDTREGKQLYNCELEEEKHDEMLFILREAPYMWALSGYREENLFEDDKYDSMLEKYSQYTKEISTYKYSGGGKRKDNLLEEDNEAEIEWALSDSMEKPEEFKSNKGKTVVKEILWRNGAY